MKTPLKSFEIIKEMYEYFIKTHRELEPKLMICEKEDFGNVETTLKKQEQDRKKLKALEIIKEKRVNVQALFYSTSCEDYNKHYTHYEDLTQEEYDLLKEELL